MAAILERLTLLTRLKFSMKFIAPVYIHFFPLALIFGAHLLILCIYLLLNYFCIYLLHVHGG